MYPAVYRSSASFMAVAGGMPILLASTCICVVSKGAGLNSSLTVTSFLVTVPVLVPEHLEYTASASSFFQKGLDAWLPSNASMPNLPTTFQYGTGTNFSISSFLSTRSFRVGLWTLPTDMKLLPTCPDDRDMSLVRTAPHDRSTICLASAAAASLSSGRVRSEKAASISPLVRALNLALLTLLMSASAYFTVSMPMSSPSLSKSVAMMISSAVLMSCLIAERMLLTRTVLICGAYIRSSGELALQSLYSEG